MKIRHELFGIIYATFKGLFACSFFLVWLGKAIKDQKDGEKDEQE